MKFLNQKGFSLIEAVASILIVTFIMISTFTILINVRNQTLASKEEIKAIEIGTRIRDNIFNNSDYSSLVSWINKEDKSFSQDNCSLQAPPFSCDLLIVNIDGENYNNMITVTFYALTSDDLKFGIVHYSIFINYYANREAEITGIIYE